MPENWLHFFQSKTSLKLLLKNFDLVDGVFEINETRRWSRMINVVNMCKFLDNKEYLASHPQ